MFSVYCRYEPGYKKRAGNVPGKGAWRVVKVDKLLFGPPVLRYPAAVCVRCPTPRRVGTRVNPRALLAEYQHSRAMARMVNAVGFKHRNRESYDARV